MTSVGKSSTTLDHYRVVFDACPDGILLADGDGIIRDVNPRLLEMFGYAPGTLEGRPVEALVPEEARERHLDYRSSYMADPTARPMGVGMELLGVRADGSLLPVEISLSPFRSSEGTWVVAMVRDVTERRRLRRFGVGALRAAEEERKRIARELHDDIAQALATILLRLKLLERQEGAEGRARVTREIHDHVDAAVESVRRISRGLRPPALEDAGVVAALQAQALSVQQTSDLVIEVDADPVDPVLDDDRRLVLFRVVQEAMTNVVKHAEAQRIIVRVRLLREAVLAEVEDDGRGIEDSVLTGGDPGLGLTGMRERAASVGGGLEIANRPEGGAVVRLIVGIRPNGEEADG